MLVCFVLDSNTLLTYVGQTNIYKFSFVKVVSRYKFQPILIPLLVGEGGEEGYREEREQLLALNQVLARQVMERSRNIIGNISSSFKFGLYLLLGTGGAY